MQDSSASTRLVARSLLSLLLIVVAAGCSDADASRAAAPTSPTPRVDTTQWLTYNNAAFGFALEYPASFVVLPEPPGAPEAPVLVRVRFLQQFLAESETRDLHPPNFHIEVFARSAGGTLRQWLASSGRVPAGAAIEPFAIAGASEALRVADQKLIAPNEFYYAASERYIYKLTPIGDAGPRMLASFRIATPK